MKNSPKLETTQTPIKRINPEVFVSSDNEYYSSVKRKIFSGFPGGSVVKNLPDNAGGMSSIPGPRRSLMPQSNLSCHTATTIEPMLVL